MADEITITSKIKVVNGAYKFERSETNFKELQTNQGGGGPGTTSVLVTEVTVVLTGKGWVWIQNLDATNFVELGFATGVYPLSLLAGAPPQMFHVNGTQTLYLKADTATCLVDVFAQNL